ncbi:MAG: alpha/beta fold hydrolase [Planctomycetaceae bacterium]|nr:alpha/beta fold hydrolase [Planctomycetaceae bacterium]
MIRRIAGVLLVLLAASCASSRSAERGRILEGMQQAMGPLPPESRRVPADLQVLKEERLAKYTLRRVTFAVEPGDRVPAILLVPHGLTRPAPAVLALHQTVAHGKEDVVGKGRPNMAYGAELAELGYVVLAPDYPGFGDYVGVDPYALGYESATMKGIWNHRRAVDVLQSLPEVDGTRIGVIGHSLGGHNALFLAAFEPRVKAVVTSCGFTSFAKYYGGNLSGWSHKGYMPKIAAVYGKDPARMPFDFPDVLVAIAPRPLFINAPLHDSNFDASGVRDCVELARRVYDPDRLVAQYPDAAHDFPQAVRQAAYAFLDRALRQ